MAKNILEGIRREEKEREEARGAPVMMARSIEFSPLTTLPKATASPQLCILLAGKLWPAWLAGLPGLRGQVGALFSEHALCRVLDPIL